MTGEDKKIEMRALTLQDCKDAADEIAANGPRDFDPMTQMYLLGKEMGRIYQHRKDVEWLEEQGRRVDEYSEVMGDSGRSYWGITPSDWQAFKNQKIE